MRYLYICVAIVLDLNTLLSFQAVVFLWILVFFWAYPPRTDHIHIYMSFVGHEKFAQCYTLLLSNCIGPMATFSDLSIENVRIAFGRWVLELDCTSCFLKKVLQKRYYFLLLLRVVKCFWHSAKRLGVTSRNKKKCTWIFDIQLLEHQIEDDILLL